MKILLVGSEGKMGKEIKQCCEDNEVVFCVDTNCQESSSESRDIKNCKQPVDVIIDFSTSESREPFLEYAKERKIPYACFATNINDNDMKKLKEASFVIPVLICKNTSVGMNVMFELVDSASKTLEADIVLTERHHKMKKDSPSGSAKALENILKKNGKIFSTYAVRAGTERGTHIVQFFMDDEILEIRHSAFSRKVFAKGALVMAKKLTEQKFGLFEKL